MLDHDDSRFLALAGLPPTHAEALGLLLLGCFAQEQGGGRQLTPTGLAAEARRLLTTRLEG